MNAEDIVKVLRHCYSKDIKGCEDCPLNESDLCYEANLELSAADLIESLQAQLAESQRRERAAAEFIHELRCDDSGDWGDIMFKIDKWRERCVKAWEVRNEN